jgi:hypothetical protein
VQILTRRGAFFLLFFFSEQQQSAGDFFMRNVALLGRLREVATTVRNNDLSAGELSKGSGICEHAVYLTALQRERVAAFKVLCMWPP